MLPRPDPWLGKLHHLLSAAPQTKPGAYHAQKNAHKVDWRQVYPGLELASIKPLLVSWWPKENTGSNMPSVVSGWFGLWAILALDT